ncbi:MAG: glycosyltransferase family 4 protein [Acidobacteriota bacterium]
MKVAVIVTGGLHPSGRTEVMPSWLSLIDRLSRAHVVHAFVLRHLPHPTTYSLAGATVHDLGRPLGRWAQWRSLRTALATNAPFDVFHAFWVDPGGLLAAIAGRWFGVPSVVTCDSGEFTSIPGLGYGLQRTTRGRLAVSLACRLATRVHVTTKYMETLARTHGCNPVTIPVGIDPRGAAVAPGGVHADRADVPPWRLLQVASLNPVKDQTTLLDAIAVVRRTDDVRLDLVGEDTLNGRLQEHAQALGLQDVVLFHGFVPHDALASFYQRAHLYVQSSRHEAAGIAVLESAASGTPVVGTRVGFVSDWAPHGAVAVNPGDADALAAAIVRLLRSAESREALARTARAFALEHDVDWTARAFGELYSSLTAAKK